MLERLRKTADYARVQAAGRRLRSTSLLLVIADNPGGPTRVGLTVSRKVGNAVVRNQVKRWLREITRQLPLPAGGPWDLVLIARTETPAAGFHALLGEVRQLWAKVERGPSKPAPK